MEFIFNSRRGAPFQLRGYRFKNCQFTDTWAESFPSVLLRTSSSVSFFLVHNIRLCRLVAMKGHQKWRQKIGSQFAPCLVAVWPVLCTYQCLSSRSTSSPLWSIQSHQGPGKCCNPSNMLASLGSCGTRRRKILEYPASCGVSRMKIRMKILKSVGAR